VKILHTADWHAGRSLHGVDRTPEIREVLQEIAEIALTQAVDLIIVAGDIYDNKNPGADADAAIYEFFMTTGAAGIPSVLIAGNHDSPSRLDAISHLLKLTNVHVVGHPQVAGSGGVFDLNIDGEVARVAALPFVSERRIVKVAELLEADPGQWIEKYQEGMRKLIGNLSAQFSNDVVNLLVMHGTMDGATLSNSEYTFHCTDTYALSGDIFPATTNYVAMGHIHKPQGISGVPEQAGRYAGSILQLDFGEQGDDKFVYIVEAQAGKPTELLEAVPLKAGKRLQRLSMDLPTFESRVADLDMAAAWYKLKLKLEAPRPGLKDRIKADYPTILTVEVNLPDVEREEEETVDLAQLNLLEAYAQYHLEKRGQLPPDDLEKAFKTLYEEEEATGSEVAA